MIIILITIASNLINKCYKLPNANYLSRYLI